MIILGYAALLMTHTGPSWGLDKECLYMVSQDIMEVCSKKEDFSKDCFDNLKKIGKINYAFFENGRLLFGQTGGADINITRRYSDIEIELRTWV